MIVVVPAATPHTLPVPDTVAIAGEELLHAPPAVVLLCSTQLLMHTDDGPVIAAGRASTVTIAVVKQPVPNEYEIVVLPADTPCTVPVVASILPTVGVLLLHVPPVVLLLSVVVAPWHTVNTPVIAAGTGFTVTTDVVTHPVGSV